MSTPAKKARSKTLQGSPKQKAPTKKLRIEGDQLAKNDQLLPLHRDVSGFDGLKGVKQKGEVFGKRWELSGLAKTSRTRNDNPTKGPAKDPLRTG